MGTKVYEIGLRRGREVPVRLGRKRKEFPLFEPVVLTDEEAQALRDQAWDVTEMTEDKITEKVDALRKQAEELEKRGRLKVEEAEAEIKKVKTAGTDPAAAAAWSSGDYNKRRKFAVKHAEESAFDSKMPSSEELKSWYEDRLGIELGE